LTTTLLELAGVGEDGRGGRLVPNVQGDALSEQPPQHRLAVGDDGLEVERLRAEHLAAPEREQLSA
jgi:hypothetical protein